MPYECNENATPFAIADRIAVATQSQQDLRETWPYIATEVGGKEEKQVDSEI